MSADKEKVIADDSKSEISISTAGTSSKETNNSSSVLAVVVVIALVVAAIALILGIVAVANGNKRVEFNYEDGDGGESGESEPQTENEGESTSGSDDDKIWQLSFEHTGSNYGYIDDATSELRGFFIDLATAICQIAGKSCEMVYDTPTRCWDSTQPGARPQGGEGLLNQYYDACVGWVHTYDRPRTFKFTTSFSFPIKTVFMVNEGNTAFEWNNIKATDKIGFVDGWAYDEHCVARAKDQITGSDLAQSQIVRYTGRDDLLAGLQNNEVDAIFDNVAAGLAKAASDYGIKIVGPALDSCAKDGLSVMTRKDNLLHTWWNPAFEKLKKDKTQWRAICNDLKDEHGHIGGPTPEEFCIDYPAN